MGEWDNINFVCCKHFTGFEIGRLWVLSGLDNGDSPETDGNIIHGSSPFFYYLRFQDLFLINFSKRRDKEGGIIIDLDY